MPVGTPFAPGQSGNIAGRPKGILSLDARVRNLLEGEERLPDAIVETIRTAIGADRRALDAVIIVGLLVIYGKQKLDEGEQAKADLEATQAADDAAAAVRGLNAAGKLSWLQQHGLLRKD